jgi:hypothetical protein
MHIENNSSDHLLKIINGGKDRVAIRKDREERGICPALRLLQDERRPNQLLMGQAPFLCTKAKWMIFLQRVVLMQQVLPICP